MHDAPTAVDVNDTAVSQVSAKSGSSADTTQTLLIRGENGAAGYEGRYLQEELALNGENTVTSTNYFRRIISLSLDTNTNGVISITEAEGGATLDRLSGIIYNRWKRIRLYPAPSTTITYNIPYIVKPTLRGLDDDVFVVDVGDLVEIGALERTLMHKKQFLKAREVQNDYEREIQNYIWDKHNQPNKINKFRPIAYSRENV